MVVYVLSTTIITPYSYFFSIFLKLMFILTVKFSDVLPYLAKLVSF
jgi:hypothetical protein